MPLNHLATLLLLLAGFAFAQDPCFRKVDKSDGLPTNDVYDIFQDSLGFMWFGTDEGLCRYDGFQFDFFYPDNITSTAVSDIQADQYNRLWFTTFDNQLYYVKNDSVFSFSKNKTSGQYLRFHILNDYLICPHIDGILVFDLVSLELIRSFDTPPILSSSGSGDRYYFITNEENLMVIDSQLQLKTAGAVEANLLFASGDYTFAVIKDHGNEIDLFKSNTQLSSIPFHAIDFIQNINCFDENLWICGRNGLYKIDLHTYETQHYFQGKSINDLYSDKHGNYWVSVLKEGLYFIPDLTNRTVQLNDFYVNIIQVHNDRIYLGGASNELAHFDPATNELRSIYKAPYNHEVYDIEFRNDHIILCSDLIRIINSAGQIEKTIPIGAKDVIQTSESYLAAATSGTCALFLMGDSVPNNPWNTSYRHHFDTQFNRSNLYSGVRARSCLYDSTSTSLYFATNAGLIKINPHGVREITYNARSVSCKKLVNYGTVCYVLSNTGILFKLANDELEAQPISIDGTPLIITNVEIAGDFLVVMTRSWGTYYYDLKSDNHKLVRVDELDIFDAVNDVVWYNGELLFAVDHQLLFINPSKIDRKKEPQFFINSIIVNNIERKQKEINDLSYNENDIRIDYSILSFAYSFDHPLYYRLNNTTWKTTNPESRSLELVSLEPGEYNLQFSFTPQQEKVVSSLQFVINKPIWQVHWFWIGIILVILILVYFFYRWQIKLIQRRNKLEMDKIELEINLNKSVLTSVRAQMNPHFFYNALNTIQSFIYSNDRKNAIAYLSSFSKLTRMILDMSAKESVTLEEELKAINLYLELEKGRFDNKLDYTIDASLDIDAKSCLIPPMIVQPYVENALKHGILHKGTPGKITLRFYTADSNLIIEIDDDGVGRKRSAEINAQREGHQSFATGANQKRLEILNARRNRLAVEYVDKKDVHGNSTGTLVILTIPIN